MQDSLLVIQTELLCKLSSCSIAICRALELRDEFQSSSWHGGEGEAFGGRGHIRARGQPKIVVPLLPPSPLSQQRVMPGLA